VACRLTTISFGNVAIWQIERAAIARLGFPVSASFRRVLVCESALQAGDRAVVGFAFWLFARLRSLVLFCR